jgi:hypothetical protein
MSIFKQSLYTVYQGNTPVPSMRAVPMRVARNYLALIAADILKKGQLHKLTPSYVSVVDKAGLTYKFLTIKKVK